MLKKFKSLFIVEEGDSSQENRTVAEKPELVNKEVTETKPVFQVTSVSTGPGKIQDKFLDVLFNALGASNQEGFDYMEYKDFLKSLANVPMDDSTRYKSAFATAQTMGATKDKIISSARHYIDILGNEQRKFQDALKGQREKNLTGKQEEIKGLEQTIKSKEAEIERLKGELQSHRQQIVTLEQEINTASDKLAQTASDFEATYQALLGQIQQDVKNIESHL